MNNERFTEHDFSVFAKTYQNMLDYIVENFEVVLFWYNLEEELIQKRKPSVDFHKMHIFSDKEDIKITEITEEYFAFTYEYGVGHYASCRDYYNPEFQLPMIFFTDLQRYVTELKASYDDLLEVLKQEDLLKEQEKQKKQELKATKKHKKELQQLKYLREKYESNS